MIKFSKVPRWLRKVICPILKLLGNERAAEIMSITYGRSTSEFFDVNRQM